MHESRQIRRELNWRIAGQEAEQRQQATKQAEADSRFQASQARDAARGFPLLPESWQGQKLDATFIKTCPADTQRLLTKRFGFAQLDARLRGN